MSPLGNISIEEFLQEYWQKKPLLVRNAFPDFVSPIDPDDMAGLSLMEEVESRIILENKKDKSWEVQQGPFNDDTFAALPEQDWTLLVQAVDQWVPEMADIMDQFNFIPNWRLDDMMASFAPKGGGVGPHFDHYDVFLIQGLGQRSWQVGPKCDESSPFLDDVPVKILKEMKVIHEWTLNPGDMLYLPPTYAHNGVALNDAMTFSVGFRAPSEADILLGLSDHLTQQLNNDQRYSDPCLSSASKQPSLINADAIANVTEIISKHLQKEGVVEQWLAQYMTESKYEGLHEPLEDPLDWDDLSPLLATESQLVKNETSRWAYYLIDKKIVLVINAEKIKFSHSKQSQELATILADNRRIGCEYIANLLKQTECQNLLLSLINGNHLYFEE
ncbi:MAG: cupin domain-containing protein [Bermanella sp.]